MYTIISSNVHRRLVGIPTGRLHPSTVPDQKRNISVCAVAEERLDQHKSFAGLVSACNLACSGSYLYIRFGDEEYEKRPTL